MKLDKFTKTYEKSELMAVYPQDLCPKSAVSVVITSKKNDYANFTKMIPELKQSAVLQHYSLNTKTQESKCTNFLTVLATQFTLFSSLRSVYQKFTKEG